jgi:hypothetical protein
MLNAGHTTNKNLTRDASSATLRDIKAMIFYPERIIK